MRERARVVWKTKVRYAKRTRGVQKSYRICRASTLVPNCWRPARDANNHKNRKANSSIYAAWAQIRIRNICLCTYIPQLLVHTSITFFGSAVVVLRKLHTHTRAPRHLLNGRSSCCCWLRRRALVCAPSERSNNRGQCVNKCVRQHLNARDVCVCVRARARKWFVGAPWMCIVLYSSATVMWCCNVFICYICELCNWGDDVSINGPDG